MAEISGHLRFWKALPAQCMMHEGAERFRLSSALIACFRLGEMWHRGNPDQAAEENDQVKNHP